jgi:uncharacterized protein (DUF1697 family)
MSTWVALLRGINVGGNCMLPMKELASLMEKCGCSEVRTYIQSGNVVFRAPKTQATQLPKRIGKLVLETRRFQPSMLVLSLEELERAVASNPFPKAAAEPKSLHLFFLAAEPKNPDVESLGRIKAASENFVFAGKVFYLHAPNGFGTSKLAARAEKLLGVPATARNWRTVTKLLEMASLRPAP